LVNNWDRILLLGLMFNHFNFKEIFTTGIIIVFNFLFELFKETTDLAS
jgi:hypothetical protein